MKRSIILFLILGCIGLTTAEAPFHRGVNLTQWFQTSDVRQVQFTKFTKQDFLNIQSLGCDVVRLPINLIAMTDGAPDYAIDPLFFYFMDQIVDWAEELDMYLLLDYHATSDETFTDPNLEDSLIKMWSQMAEHYKDHSNFILYEIINEPHDISDAKWNAIQQNVLQTIRTIDTKHTIIVTPAGWGSYNNLDDMPVLDDDNIIYSFHFYDPFLFTHQGATWSNMGPLRGVPFPYDADEMPEVPEELEDTWIANSLRYSYKTDGTVANVKKLIDIAIQFRDERNVDIFCGEFGVYDRYADPEDRVFWYGVAPLYLSENNIPWTMWDYKGGFGLFEKGTAGLFEYDVNVPLVEAMGLTPPPQKEFEIRPDTVGFAIYTDFFAQHVYEASSGGSGIINFYAEPAVLGDFCIRMAEVDQYNNTGFNFQPNKDLSALMEQGYALDFWCKSPNADMKFDIRFIDTKTDNSDDHPWRMRVTIDNSMAAWDGEWNHLQIPLDEFVEHGSWDNGWFNPRGDFDWTKIDRLEFVSEHSDFKGKELWLDHIRVVDPTKVMVDDTPIHPTRLHLEQNYPNPFNPITTIKFSLPRPRHVSLSIFDVQGRLVTNLVSKALAAGFHTVQWNGHNSAGQPAASGVYVYMLETKNKRESKQLLLLR